MSDPFCWYELMTTDTASAGDFYAQVVGWKTRPMPGGALPYTVFETPKGGVGGVLELPEGALKAGMRPGWLGFVAVADVDASLAKAVSLGGSARKPAEDIPTVGRFAIAADPAGAAFVLFKPLPGYEGGPPDGSGPGYPSWRELMAGDLDQAWAFYSALFGWTKAEAHDMGPMGVYQLFSTGGAPAGGMMTKPPSLPASFWNYYFGVDSIKAAIGRLTARGGKVINGPHQVPGGDWVVQAMDPQGALFCLTSQAE